MLRGFASFALQGVYEPVTLELMSTSLGLISTLTTTAPISGSYTFIVPTPPLEPVTDAYIAVFATDISVESALFSIYLMQSLSNVTVPADTLFKGETYRVSIQEVVFPARHSGLITRVKFLSYLTYRSLGKLLAYLLSLMSCCTKAVSRVKP